jgi:hypothetical protein
MERTQMTRPRPGRRLTRLPALIAVIAFLIFIALAAPAAPALGAAPAATAQDLVNAQLAAAPGGKQISATEVSYGDFVVTVVRPATSVDATADCPSGWFCFYDHTNYGYPRGKLSSCGWQDLATWGWNDRTESVHYNMSTGSVSFINHGSRPDHSDDRVVFSVSTSNRFLPDVGVANRNIADHVYRYC